MLFKNLTTGNIFISDNPNQPSDCMDITNTKEGENYFLQKSKTSKITELKLLRDNANIENSTYTGAREIIVNNDGTSTFGNIVSFIFECKITNYENGASHPDKILSFCINRSKSISYSCKIQEEGGYRKGLVEITPQIAEFLENHIAERNTLNYLKYNAKIIEIDQILNSDLDIKSKISKIESITWL